MSNVKVKSVYEETDISKAILRVALPAMLGQLTTLIYNIADTYFVSLTHDPAKVAAVTLCSPVLLIIMSIACVFGMGGNSVIARLLGESKEESAKKIFNFSAFAIILAGILVLVFGICFKSQTAKIIGADTDTYGYTCGYLLYIFIGAPFIMISNGYVGLFRSVGLIKQSTIGLALGNIINIILDYVFIILMNMGTAGAALATSVGFLCSSVYFLICVFLEVKKGSKTVDLSLHIKKPDSKLIKDTIAIGIPGSLITVLMSVSNIVLNNYIGIYGSNAVASYGIAYKIDMVPVMLLVGLSQGVAPLIGYYFGAREIKRMSKTMILSTVYGVVIGGIFTAIFLMCGKALSAVFMEDNSLVEQTAYFLKVMSLSAPTLGIINMVSSYFQAVGKAVPSLTITLLRNVVLFIPGVIILNHFMQLDGVIAAQPVVEIILMFICIFMYYHSADKYKKQDFFINSIKKIR